MKMSCQISKYLFSDLDEQDEDHEDEQIVEDAQSSDGDVDDLQYSITDVGEILRPIV